MPTEELFGAYHFLLEVDDSAAKDSFDFTTKGGTQQVGLLLPAVQAAREAAPATDDLDLTTKDEGGTAYEYKLDGVMISSYDVGGASSPPPVLKTYQCPDDHNSVEVDTSIGDFIF